VREELGLAVSVGIGPSRTIAKLASDAAKPDGLLEVTADAVQAFLHPLPVGRLWGIGPVAEAKLRAAGFETVGDLAGAGSDTLLRLLGDSLGPHAAALARGLDERPVEPERAPVSYSEENTFESDVGDRERLRAVLLDHAESVARRLRRDGWLARTVVLKVKLARRRAPGPRGYPILTRRATLPEPSDDGAAFARVARELLEKTPAVPVRLVGVGATRLVAAQEGQLGLFEPSPARGRVERLNRALDEIADRFGSRAVVRAAQEQATRAGLTLQRKRGETDE
jgi:DNA polymerase-4